MSDEKPSRNILRKKAHNRALGRLTNEHPIEFAAFQLQIEKEQPGIGDNALYRKTRARLRLKFPGRFEELYTEEKERLRVSDLPRKDYEKLIQKAVELYDNGNGMTFREIANYLDADYTTIRRGVRRAGATGTHRYGRSE